MKRSAALLGVFIVAVAVVIAQAPGEPLLPLADHHQHLFSPALIALISSTPPVSSATVVTAKDLIAILDAAGIKRAAVLSTAYIFTQPSRNVENDHEKVKTENDWTASQVALFPDRLIGLCGINPLKGYALEEVARCAKSPGLRRGLKLHFGNSVVDYHNTEHVEQLRRVFKAANDARMAIVVHMRSSTTYRLPYGRDEAVIFLNEVLPAAPDVPIQIAHLAGAGGFADPSIDPALRVFIEAIARNDARTRGLWFDVSGVVAAATTPEQAALIATRLKELGVQRILYGTDGLGVNSARDGWASFLKLPLTDSEFGTIANNVAPYMR
jgi:predicted TIM-barrel fold metal-dependent hydrolase